MGYIYLKSAKKGESVKTREVELDECHLVFDFDKDDKLIGIEVFNADKTLHPDTIKLLTVLKDLDEPFDAPSNDWKGDI